MSGLLLSGDGALRALARACVGLGALPADGQVRAVTAALVAADLHLAADVGGDLATEVALGLVVGLDVVAEGHQLVVVQLVDPQVGADAGGGEGLVRTGATDPEDVRESN